MKKILKHSIYIILSIFLVITLICPVNALNNQQFVEAELTKEYLDTCSIEQLYDLSHVVEEEKT